MRKFWLRIAGALVMYLIAVYVFSGVHDYPQFRGQLEAERQGDPIAIKRPWLRFFYFINEAGSGIKFAVTGNPRHLAHFPMSEPRQTGYE